jgi:hypothetical protein
MLASLFPERMPLRRSNFIMRNREGSRCQAGVSCCLAMRFTASNAGVMRLRRSRRPLDSARLQPDWLVDGIVVCMTEGIDASIEDAFERTLMEVCGYAVFKRVIVAQRILDV